jgi:hypothetical protein
LVRRFEDNGSQKLETNITVLGPRAGNCKRSQGSSWNLAPAEEEQEVLVIIVNNLKIISQSPNSFPENFRKVFIFTFIMVVKPSTFLINEINVLAVLCHDIRCTRMFESMREVH